MTEPELARVRLEPLLMASRKYVGENANFHPEASTCMDVVLGGMVAEINAKIMALPGERITIDEDVPETWWDHFKIRWFPAWAIRRWPARVRRIHVDQQTYKAVCPHIRPTTNDGCYEFLCSHSPLD